MRIILFFIFFFFDFEITSQSSPKKDQYFFNIEKVQPQNLSRLQYSKIRILPILFFMFSSILGSNFPLVRYLILSLNIEKVQSKN